MMSKLRRIAIMFVPRHTVLFLCFAACFLAPESRAQELPDGAGKDVVQKACNVCHPATLVMGRQLSRDEWGAEVTKMVEQGAKLTDAEFTQVVDYLAKTFPPDPAAAQQAAAGGGRGNAKAGEA